MDLQDEDEGRYLERGLAWALPWRVAKGTCGTLQSPHHVGAPTPCSAALQPPTAMAGVGGLTPRGG